MNKENRSQDININSLNNAEIAKAIKKYCIYNIQVQNEQIRTVNATKKYYITQLNQLIQYSLQ